MEVYLDYSATTKVDEKVLNEFINTSVNYYANPNSMHTLGLNAKKKIDDAIKNISDYFGVKESEIIFTSGASEANNMVFKGLESSDKNEIIVTKFEHSSIYGPLSYLQKQGFNILFAPTKDGIVDVKELEKMISDKTLLVSVCAVNSEVGIIEPIAEIGKMLSKYDGVYFHSDITQALGKIQIDLSNVDLASFSGHKIFCFKGIGGLIKKENVKLQPLINGGKSTTIYRSGTPQTELISALSESFNLFKNKEKDNFEYVKNLNVLIRKELTSYQQIIINSGDNNLPYILNISFLGKKSKDIQKYFNNKNIYISTQTACSSNNDYSKTIYELTGDQERASSSIRISLSYKTTKQEITYFLDSVKELMNNYEKDY